jgi:hypothetical protein
LGGPDAVKWGLRAGLGALLILTLGVKFAGPHPADQTLDPGADVASILGKRLSGAISNNGWGSATNASRVITAPVAGCRDPLTIVTVMPPSFNSADALEAFQRPGDRHYFVYLNWISSKPDRWLLLRMRIWQRAREMLNMSEYSRTNTILYVIEDPNCRVAETSDWRRYWMATP